MAELVRSDGTDYLLNGVARSPGLNNTFWSTDLRLLNPNDSPLLVTFDSLGMSAGASTLLRQFRRQVCLRSLTFWVPAALAFCKLQPVPCVCAPQARFCWRHGPVTETPVSAEPGSFSAFQRPASFARGFVASPTLGLFTAIKHTYTVPGYRTNLAFLAGSSGASGVLVLRDRYGVQSASMPLSLGPSEWIQKSASDWFGASTIPLNARVDVQLNSGSIHGYASRIDNGTGDAVVLPLTPVSGSPGPGSSPQISGCSVFPADNPWNRDISSDPVDSQLKQLHRTHEWEYKVPPCRLRIESHLWFSLRRCGWHTAKGACNL